MSNDRLWTPTYSSHALSDCGHYQTVDTHFLAAKIVDTHLPDCGHPLSGCEDCCGCEDCGKIVDTHILIEGKWMSRFVPCSGLAQRPFCCSPALPAMGFWRRCPKQYLEDFASAVKKAQHTPFLPAGCLRAVIPKLAGYFAYPYPFKRSSPAQRKRRGAKSSRLIRHKFQTCEYPGITVYTNLAFWLSSHSLNC